jgi:hypothetical protein
MQQFLLACLLVCLLLFGSSPSSRGQPPATNNGLGTTDQLDLRPNVGPEQMPSVTTWRTYVSIALLIGVAVLFGMLLWVWLRVPPPASELPPHEWALTELDKLGDEEPVHAEEIRLRYTWLSYILRQYLDRQFQFNSVEQTTPEFVAALQINNCLGAEQKTQLVALLQQADLVKFAGMIPPMNERKEFRAVIRRFILDTSRKPAEAVESLTITKHQG